METSVSVLIHAKKSTIWNIVTDIENAKDRIRGIKALTVLEKGNSDLVGFKWKETRKMFGKEAEETMWIKEAEKEQFYLVEAENSGCMYHTRIALDEKGDAVELSMSFKSIPQTFVAKLMSPLMTMMKGTMKKMILEDLEDIKKACIKETAN